MSYDTPRDGVTLSAKRDVRPLVLPAEVARLENLTGYLKFPGAWPVARIGLTYTARPRVAERFVPREDGEGGGDGGCGSASYRGVAIGAVEPTIVGDRGSADECRMNVSEAADTGNATAAAETAGELDVPGEGVDGPKGESAIGWDDGAWTPHEWALCDPDDETGTLAGAGGCPSDEGAGTPNAAESKGKDGADERHPQDWQ